MRENYLVYTNMITNFFKRQRVDVPAPPPSDNSEVEAREHSLSRSDEAIGIILDYFYIMVIYMQLT